MAAYSVSEAALRTGHSRAQLCCLIKDGTLKGYLRSTPTGQRLLELAPPDLPPLIDCVTACTRLRISNKPKPKPAPEPVPDPDLEAFLSRLWGPMTPIVNRALADQGWPPLEPAQLLAIAGTIEQVISRDFPVHDTTSREWWADWLEIEGEDPWRCGHCGEPWNPQHPEYRRPVTGKPT
ncbi:hypothetical protein [Synechococcus sp. CS-1332]|uniref:hypothetical protein n=1 Tax=Synechococcus sp. CS-1332 TaxID=2847972 RepID=UPI00223B2D3B|nr:hypothetical protein [Synechococcus sp. CS-1332]MCT0208654.1 hypothetical protein [Synechococcus sp. CS-1332]